MIIVMTRGTEAPDATARIVTGLSARGVKHYTRAADLPSRAIDLASDGDIVVCFTAFAASNLGAPHAEPFKVAESKLGFSVLALPASMRQGSVAQVMGRAALWSAWGRAGFHGCGHALHWCRLYPSDLPLGGDTLSLDAWHWLMFILPHGAATRGDTVTAAAGWHAADKALSVIERTTGEKVRKCIGEIGSQFMRPAAARLACKDLGIDMPTMKPRDVSPWQKMEAEHLAEVLLGGVQ